MATAINNGALVTSGAGQTEYNMVDPMNSSGQVGRLVMIEILSGSIQFAVGQDIDSSHATYSTAGDKTIRTCSNASLNSLRSKGAGTFRISW